MLTTPSLIEKASSLAEVEYAEANYILKLQTIPDDTYFSRQWGLYNTGQDLGSGLGSGTNDADIDAPRAWDTQTGDSSIVIAVLDSGVDFLHPELSSRIFQNTSEDVWSNSADPCTGNGVDDDDNGYTDDRYGINAYYRGQYDPYCLENDPMDWDGHGTHAAGIIAAQFNNNKGVAGVCSNCRILPISISSLGGTLSAAAACDGLDYAITQQADLVNISWGGETSSQSLQNCINNARNNDLILIAAAGNCGDPATYAAKGCPALNPTLYPATYNPCFES